jgi:hypothetical protein
VSINSYTELKTAIADWINRDDLTDARLSDFVQLAESRIYHELRIPPMEKYANLTTDSEGRVTLPSDYLEAKDVLFNDRTLTRISLSQYFSYAQSQGVPMFFARETIYLRLIPLPAPDVEGLKMVYYAEPERLSDENQTNPVFEMAPQIYLYGSLVEAGSYLGSPPEKLGLWMQNFEDAMARLTRHATLAESAGSTPAVANGY